MTSFVKISATSEHILSHAEHLTINLQQNEILQLRIDFMIKF